MSLNAQSPRVLVLTAALAAILTAPGCSDQQLRLVPVKGRVTLNKIPVEGVHVNFYSDEDILAHAVTNELGEFELMTREKPGATVGNHRVSIRKHEPPPEGATMAAGPPAPGGKGKGGGKGKDAAKDSAESADEAPAKKEGPNQDDLVKMAKSTGNAPAGPRGFAAKMSIQDRPNLLPWQYADPKTSEYGNVEVPEEGLDNLEFSLVGQPGGAPPPPKMEDEPEEPAQGAPAE